MDISNKKIIVGGWPAFAEATGVNKKEPMENFDWMPSEPDKFYYNDMRSVLDSIDGARDWLKNYTYDENGSTYPFSDEMGRKVGQAMSKDHSGATGNFILIQYSKALKDWDSFVFKIKEYHGRREFKRQQVPYELVTTILGFCDSWFAGGGVGPAANELEKDILTRCAMLCLTGTVPEIQAILKPIQKDYEEIYAEEKRQREEANHRELMGCIKFLYKHPIRWFDTPSGCTLLPVHPVNITKRAIAEMEAQFPGYDKHIENVLVAMGSPRKPSYNEDGSNGIFSESGLAVWTNFLRSQKVIA